MTFAGEGAITLPVGSTSVRPTAAAGMVRYNNTTFAFEGYGGSSPAWGPLTTSTGITGTIGTSGSGLDVELAAGSATAPSLTFNEDTQTGIYQPSAHTMAITTNGIESVAFDASGNLNLIKSSGAYEINSNPVLAIPAADTTYSLAVGNGVLTSDSHTGGSYNGEYNTGVGYQAEYTNGTGYDNTALGTQALYTNLSGVDNTGVGVWAGYYVTGNSNTAVGNQAMEGIAATPLTGASNSALGAYALNKIQGAATENTGVGYAALFSATTGTNSALGYSAGYYITTGTGNTAIGFNAMAGVAATPLTGGQNTAVGDSALTAIQGAASQNTAVGYQALATLTTATATAVGYQAGQYFIGGGNAVAIGIGAMTGVSASPNTGWNNTAVGANALNWVQGNAGSNTALGDAALQYDSTGGLNTAVGAAAMSGVSATPLTGGNSTAVGYSALGSIQGAGGGNTAVGMDSLDGDTTGGSNTAIGYGAGNSGTAITTGGSDTFLGYDTGSNGATYTNSTAVGAYTEITASNQIRIGCTSGTNGCSASVSSIGGPTTWTSTSDRRLKKDIRETDLGLDFIEKLRPVSFYFKSGDGKLNYGFIAQDVQEALGNRDTHTVIRESDDMGTYMLTYDDLLSPVVKSIQQQQQEITDDNAALKQLIAAQEKEIEELRQQIRNLTAAHAH